MVLLLLAVSATRSVFHRFYTGDFAISAEQAMDWFFFRY